MKSPGYDATPYLPEKRNLKSLREALPECRGCPLYKHATQAVFGEGRSHPRLVIVGEQPGNEEDLSGRPFVGPAGRILDEVLDAAGIDRSEIYVTNAVKHFKFTGRGKRRLHAKPGTLEIRACHPWLEEELRYLKPEIVVCMGATAAHSVYGKATPVLANRGRWIPSAYCERTLITTHPSSILRVPDREVRRHAMESMIEDFGFVAAALRGDQSASFATAAEFMRRRNHSYDRFSTPRPKESRT